MIKRMLDRFKQYRIDMGLLENGFDKIRINLGKTLKHQEDRTSRHSPAEYQLMIDQIYLLIEKVTPTIEASELNIKTAKETIIEMNKIIKRYQTEKDQSNGKTY